ncbi:MAG: hypothetical protein EOM12_03460 [Verrucomicrobiae bacterium]|nr:hypothetical protein [Verrucomicrobiae bacterium]
MKKIIRVFPRKTNVTPSDECVRIGVGPDLFDEADEVHISVAFTWDLPLAERLAKEWAYLAPVKMGGPALNTRGEGFTPGLYVKHGFTITSRGCPNKCWFCSVWKREGGEVRELPIQEGWNILDDNLLACSDSHIRAVFAMLERQKEKPMFTGGLEAKILKPWHCAELRKLKPKRLYFAYDTPDDLEPLREAGKMLREVGFTTASHSLCAYVLCGWPKDREENAEERMRETIDAGFTPMAMLYRDQKGERDPMWRSFARRWARPAIIYSNSNAKGN